VNNERGEKEMLVLVEVGSGTAHLSPEQIANVSRMFGGRNKAVVFQAMHPRSREEREQMAAEHGAVAWFPRD